MIRAGFQLMPSTTNLLTLFLVVFLQSTKVLAANMNNQTGRREALPYVSTTDQIKQRYPNLYFSANDVPRLRLLVNTSHAHLYTKLTQIVREITAPPDSWKNFSARWNVVYGNSLATLATYCVLTPHDHQAFGLAKLFMDKFVRYPSWRVQSKEKDDVPVAHTLLGFLTAFDFLHDTFTSSERLRYRVKLREISAELYEMSYIHWWGRSFIHNHVLTNYVALLTAAIVLRPYYPDEAMMWQKKAIVNLDGTMQFLNLVVDGSLQEGVSYGSYSTKSITQFMFFTERHFRSSYSNNTWVRAHLDFLIHSILPGFQMTVGFADSNQDWSYGPQSQLTFLESYVYRDGKAIWLANQIRKFRWGAKIRNLLALKYSTLHTELLFYNDTIKETPSNHSKLHVFSDWGVITYGGGTPAGDMFLSFKCGRLHGRAINTLRPKLSKLLKSGFNPGHEHPDHGSFVFISKEQPVVTETLYGPKLTFLQNSLMFGSAKHSTCSRGYQGQLGEGRIWFNHSDSRTWQANGELVGYSQHGDVVFMSGDMTAWYDQCLGLDSVYRSLVMLSPTALVVIDVIRRRKPLVATHASAFFHNVHIAFEKRAKSLGRQPCARVGRFSLCWANYNSRTVNVTTQTNFKIKGAKYATNFINVTSRFLKPLSSTAYVFHGPDDILHHVEVKRVLRDGININLQLNSDDYDINVSTRPNNPRLRRRFVGSAGYSTLRINKSMPIHLGLKTKAYSQTSKTEPALNLNETDGRVKVQSPLFFYTALILIIILFCLYLYYKNRFWFYRSYAVCCTVPSLLLLWVLALLVFFCMNYKRLVFPSTSTSFSQSQFQLPAERQYTRLRLEAVILTGLPFNGAEIVREMFTTNTDFVMIDVPSADVVTPSDVSVLQQSLDFCEWGINDSTYNYLFVEWWGNVTKTPVLLRKHNTKERISLTHPLHLTENYETEIRKSKGAFAVVHFKNPGWLFRVSWLNSGFLRHTLAPVLYVVRDPRSWIEHVLSNDSRKNTFLSDLVSVLRKDLREHAGCVLPTELCLSELCLSGLCPSDISSSVVCPSGIHGFLQARNGVGLKPHVVLAYIWVAFVLYASKLMAILPSGRFRIVRLENLLASPKETSEDIYSFLQMPFSAAVEHRILQVTKTGIFKIRNYGKIQRRLLSTWGKVLTRRQVSEIEEICRKAMRKIGYISNDIGTQHDV